MSESKTLSNGETWERRRDGRWYMTHAQVVIGVSGSKVSKTTIQVGTHPSISDSDFATYENDNREG